MYDWWNNPKLICKHFTWCSWPAHIFEHSFPAIEIGISSSAICCHDTQQAGKKKHPADGWCWTVHCYSIGTDDPQQQCKLTQTMLADRNMSAPRRNSAIIIESTALLTVVESKYIIITPLPNHVTTQGCVRFNGTAFLTTSSAIFWGITVSYGLHNFQLWWREQNSSHMAAYRGNIEVSSKTTWYFQFSHISLQCLQGWVRQSWIGTVSSTGGSQCSWLIVGRTLSEEARFG